MTRRHYVMLAEALKKAGDHAGGIERTDQHYRDCNAVANALAADNPRFDRARFLKAAGVTP